MSDRHRPHVVFFSCDHLRADNLGCNGHPVIQTPQIDKLGAQGVNFAGAFSECPVCVPARRIMMTGMDTYGIHLSRNRDTQPFPEGPKLAELMTRAGYQTFAGGKLHTCPQRNRIGFEDVQLNEEGRKQNMDMDDYEAFLHDSGYGHRAYTHGLGNNEYGLRLSPLPEPYTTTHWTAQKAMEFVQRRDPTRPFFMHVSFDKPHPPITPPAEYYELYRDSQMPQPSMGGWVENKTPARTRQLQRYNDYEWLRRNPLAMQQSLRGFAAMITHIDSMVGVILGQLREHGLFNDTLIVFTSDHGDQLFDHGNFAKGDFFRGSTNVPFIVRPPSSWAQENDFFPGRVNQTTPVGLQDIMPTILDICGVEVPSSVAGTSLTGVLKDDSAPFREYTFGHCTSAYAVSDGTYKYQWFDDEGQEFLFDLRNDPHDCHDLAESPEHAETTNRLRAQLIEWMGTHGDEHVKEGTLVTTPRDLQLERAHAGNCWNNRGRH